MPARRKVSRLARLLSHWCGNEVLAARDALVKLASEDEFVLKKLKRMVRERPEPERVRIEDVIQQVEARNERASWIAEFEAAARRPLEVHILNSFIKTYKPVMDDAPFRAFDTMEDYRRWCEQNLPGWLGYGRAL